MKKENKNDIKGVKIARGDIGKNERKMRDKESGHEQMNKMKW